MIAVFSPEQIKSATANTGTFSADNPDIRYNIADDTPPSQSPVSIDTDQQFADTKRQYGGRAAYDKAKAAGKTKLGYRQWVQVRTPAFKAWFGDWESATKSNLLNGEPLSTLKTADAPIGGYAVVENWAAGIFEKQGGKAYRPDLGEVVLDRRSAKSSLAERRAQEICRALGRLRGFVSHNAREGFCQHFDNCKNVRLPRDCGETTPKVERE